MAERSHVTCHVLDATLGKPAAGIAVALSALRPAEGAEGAEGSQFAHIAQGTTDADGRCSALMAPESTHRLPAGVYKMLFRTAPYHAALGVESFYPFVEITFAIKDPAQHYHIPLLLSPCSYTTYRGS